MDLFFDLLRVSIGEREGLSRVPSDREWNALMKLATEQALIGVCFFGINRLPKEQMPPQGVLLKWMALANVVRQRNALLNDRCGEVMQKFEADGFCPVILKGQGNALMYPDPAARQCGDIDVWLHGDKKRIVDYVNSIDSKEHFAHIHHIDLDYFKDVHVEVHYALGMTNASPLNKSIYNWFNQLDKTTFPSVTLPNGKNIRMMPLEVNLVYQLCHIDQHFGPGGIGLRQILDYYYLLHQAKSHGVDFQAIKSTVRKLGMLRLAEALMYVLRELFGLGEELMPFPINERTGKFLLKEIMISGNLGKKRRLTSKGSKRRFQQLSKFFYSTRFLPYFPGTFFCYYYRAVYWRMKHYVKE
ncbi:MAG: nucleotidyltransferase family protein [Bacteroidales bacterium]|nr:nucleotidyltransferase family protein [Bacteroidales bacterium]